MELVKTIRGLTSLQRRLSEFRRSLLDCIAAFVFALCGILSILVTFAILVILIEESIGFFAQVPLYDFLTDTVWTPLFASKRFGILPLICGTFLTSAIALLISVPIGIIIAIYLSEFSNPKLRAILKPVLELLAGIPTVVYGYFALFVVTPFLQRIIPGLAGFNALSPGIVMGIMILPMIVSLSEDALSEVPFSYKQGAYALGATRLQAIFGVFLPSASSGILSAIILAMSRAVGETMIVAIAAGQRPVLTLNPLQPIETMTAYIVQVSLGDTPHGSLAYKTIFAVGFCLFILTLCFNSLSLYIKMHYGRHHRR